MKAMLLAGATLMIGASVYGIVDYRKTSHRKEFKALYKEDKVVAPIETKSEPVTKKDDVKVEKASTSTTKEITGKTAGTTTKSGDFVTRVVKKKRRLRSELFSRAPLKDEYYELKVDKKSAVADTAIVVKGKD